MKPRNPEREALRNARELARVVDERNQMEELANEIAEERNKALFALRDEKVGREEDRRNARLAIILLMAVIVVGGALLMLAKL